ncbi:hypothetical protein A1O1_08809 [Capronia coronata CBS 617.96]|uniref:Uncharacterized protein n=1 Tax=Capronia coronata CBS 617.96 TaxID=1182541 RepID=W9Y7P4_9EURO|nr:uncharacterized protein A1O1_08809 [Capronia coronata CBS 617.96]EXJ78409.1 hypothetical protein A1O1_08809 [Capronia coronata CBS 617.96]
MIRVSQDGAEQTAQPQKFLRYRSLRKSSVKNSPSEPAPPLPQPSPPSQTSITRVPSRYRRKPKPETTPPLPQTLRNHDTTAQSEPLPGEHHPAAEGGQVETQSRSTNNGSHAMVSKGNHRLGASESRTRGTSHKHTTSIDSTAAEGLRRSYEVAREEARLILEGEVVRLAELRAREAQRRLGQQGQRGADRDRARTNESGGRDAEHVESHGEGISGIQERSRLDGHRGQVSREKDPTERRPVEDSTDKKTRKLIIGGPPLLRRSNRHSRASSGEQRRSPQRGDAGTDSVGTVDESRRAIPPMNAQNFYAPVSAVNAGERRVSIQHRTTSITLPVTPSTTTKDILKSASMTMSEQVDPRTAVLLESYSQLGLERPLRRYERIRDVMNSWDNDNQNRLFLVAEDEYAAQGLGFGDAPRQQPAATTVQIYHSHKPGRWDKRWVRLREDGQMTISKKENGLDSTNICHLSDFDVYTPTASQMKKLKPPKKLCFAFKSQAKSSMFLSGANFVHFFCTKDKATADKWYQAVHSWRSWYLVNMLGEGQHTPSEPAISRQQLGTRLGTGQPQEVSSYVRGSTKHFHQSGPPRSSVEGSRRTTSGISRRQSQDVPRPLIDFVPERQLTPSRPGTPTFHPPKPPMFPPSAFPTKHIAEPVHSSKSDDAEGPFTGTGLLARSASRRSQGGSRSGRGVQGVDGKPLVDIHPTSEFTDGSLLRKMEAIAAQQGAMKPRIDREKWREMDVPVGEGFD